ncbi:hypothetical protein MKW98_023345 [Papaver atlanticum]|uniref:Uncharacterized protein n=1 Tax=Papaver atlanticum TaxID=357466 RepID=A0AAD4SYJ3_9MAGN|nr:hypothetical protein MKW98_023345 [Papaver atlanticum]
MMDPKRSSQSVLKSMYIPSVFFIGKIDVLSSKKAKSKNGDGPTKDKIEEASVYYNIFQLITVVKCNNEDRSCTMDGQMNAPARDHTIFVTNYILPVRRVVVAWRKMQQ